MKLLSVVLIAATLLAACTGYAHLGLSAQEEQAYTRSDSDCDRGSRSSELGGKCYVPVGRLVLND